MIPVSIQGESFDYLRSQCGHVHVINAKVDGPTLEAGILCTFSYGEPTIRISDDHHSFLIELPEELRSKGDKVKAFNIPLTILDHEPV